VEQQAVSSEAAELPVDGRGRHAQVAGDLPVGHAADGLGQQLGQWGGVKVSGDVFMPGPGNRRAGHNFDGATQEL
jgi:hypothetical protein